MKDIKEIFIFAIKLLLIALAVEMVVRDLQYTLNFIF